MSVCFSLNWFLTLVMNTHRVICTAVLRLGRFTQIHLFSWIFGPDCRLLAEICGFLGRFWNGGISVLSIVQHRVGLCGFIIVVVLSRFSAPIY
jgi:hypothetical protein